MKCRSLYKKISAYLDGEVPEEERHSIAEHLKTCENCRRELEELALVSDSLDLLEKTSAPPFFAARVKRRIARCEEVHPLPLSFAERVRRVTMPVAAAAVLCVAVLVGGSLGKEIYELRAERVRREEAEIADFVGGGSYNGLSDGSLVSAYTDILSAEGE